MTEVQTETGVLAGDERMLIDGELEYTSSGAKFDVIHPASEQVAGQATDGTVEDMERAVGAARLAFDTTDCRAISSSVTTASPNCMQRSKRTKSGCAAS